LKKQQLKATSLYPASVAAQWLNITKETVKDYLRTGKLTGKQIGPLKEWHAYGSGIIRLRKDWGLV
jgi:hypothetical protein